MKLPVTMAVSPEGQWRRLADVWIDHALAAGEELAVASARAVGGDDAATRALQGVAVLSIDAPAEAVSSVIAAFDEHRSAWPVLMDPRRDSAATSDLLARGFLPSAGVLFAVKRAPPTTAVDGGLILPGRAARSAYAAWCAERSADAPPAAVLPRHLDDPQYELLLALRDGRPVGSVGLQVRGQTGLVCDLFVVPAARREGLASTLLGHAAGLAARAQLVEVFSVASADDAASVGALRRGGFEPARDIMLWSPPQR